MEKTAIVLSGGGSCGAYEMGVWKALRRLGIDYQIVTGVSVGALNGFLMVQNDYKVAYKMWSNVGYDLLFNNFINANDKNLTNTDIYMKYVNGFLENGGMDITKLELAVTNLFDENKFYNSNIDFGIMVYNLSELKSEALTKSEIPKDKAKDYIIASATCFPAFKIKEIGDKKYIDGGYGDNLPINLAIKMGATKIIAVDLGQVGFKKTPKQDNVEIKYIRPKNDIGSFLIFEKNQAQKNISYGYNDTMKMYGELVGNKFTFYKFGYSFFTKQINKKLKQYINNIDKNVGNKQFSKIKSELTKKALNINNLEINDFLNQSIDILGSALKINDTKIYFIYQFNGIVKRKFKKIEDLNYDLLTNKIKNKQISSLLGSKYIVKYIYENLKANKNSELSLLYVLFKKEFLAALYLICIE